MSTSERATAPELEAREPSSSLVVDACVHPFMRETKEIYPFLPKQYQNRFFPGLGRHFYPAPISEFLPESRPDPAAEAGARSGGSTKVLNLHASLSGRAPGPHPASDRELVRRHVLEEAGADYAVLVPFTRGLLPDPHLVNVICEATNRWLAEAWLTGAENGRFRGSIRINPDDADHAIAEIGRWADHPAFVQVAVPMQSHHPYGQPRFHRIWAEAAAHNLPVAVAADRANAVEFAPTYVGYPTHFIEFAAQYPLVFITHLVSLIAEGVFERMPDLQFVFTDGGIDLVGPVLWRFDKDWRPTHIEVPWVRQMPTDYLRGHVRFCSSGFEGPQSGDESEYQKWLDLASASELLLFASHHPLRGHPGTSRLNAADEDTRSAVLGRNAQQLYGIPNA